MIRVPAAVNLASPSRIREPEAACLIFGFISRLRTCWVTRSPVGWAVIPARCTRPLGSATPLTGDLVTQPGPPGQRSRVHGKMIRAQPTELAAGQQPGQRGHDRPADQVKQISGGPA